MSKRVAVASTILICLAFSQAAIAADLKARFTDPQWNGRKVPKGQQCTSYGGAGATPPMEISGVPADANAIIVAFSDESFSPMDKGGHGIVGFEINADRPVLLPAVPGETDTLPAGVWTVQANKARSIARGAAYLPPCSGGMGNNYTATIKAVRLIDGGDFELLARTKIKLGKY